MNICCQHLKNICVNRIYILLQGPTVQWPNCPLFQGGQLGPGAQLSGAQLSAPKKWTVGPRTVGPRGPAVRGPTVRPEKLDSWAPDSLALEQCINSTDIYVLEMLAAYIHYKCLILRMYISQPCVQRAHRNPSILQVLT